MQTAISWEVPLSPSSHSSRARNFFSTRISPSTSSTTRGQVSKDVHEAELRRRRRLEETRERSRAICDRAKAVASDQAKKAKDEVARMRAEIARKQAEAASRRERNLRLKKQHQQQQHGELNENKTTIVKSPPSGEDEQRTWRARFRAIQRLVCVVARSRLHNARAKFLCMKVRSARQLQSYWRDMVRVRLIRGRGEEIDRILINGLEKHASFDETARFMQSSSTLQVAEVLAPNRVKIFLASRMILEHSEEVLSVSARRRHVLEFASGRLWRVVSRLGNCLLMDYREFKSSLEAFDVLFSAILKEDAQILVAELYQSLVQFRLSMEESPQGSEERQIFEGTFLKLMGKLKRLLSKDEQKYKSLLRECASEVKRRRRELNVERELALNRSPLTTMAEPSSLTSSATTASLDTSSCLRETIMPEIDVTDLTTEEWTSTLKTSLSSMCERINLLTPRRFDMHDEVNDLLERFTQDDAQLINLLTLIQSRLVRLSDDGAFEEISLDPITNLKKASQARFEISAMLKKFASALDAIEKQVTRFHLTILKHELSSDETAFDALLSRLNGTKAHARQALSDWLCQLGLASSPEVAPPAQQQASQSPTKLKTGRARVGQSTTDENDLYPKLVERMRRVPALSRLGEGLARLVTDEISWDDCGTWLDDFERSRLRKLSDRAKDLLREAHNQVVFKQTMVTYNPANARQADEMRCGLAVESVVEAYRSAVEGAVSPEAVASLTNLVLNADKSSLTRLLTRRLAVLMVKGLDEQESLKGLGMALMRAEIKSLCDDFTRLVLVIGHSTLLS